jgi:molecular chaperone GrpE
MWIKWGIMMDKKVNGCSGDCENQEEDCKTCNCNPCVCNKDCKNESVELKQTQQLVELQKQHAELKNTIQRVYAEFQNYKKRTDEDKGKFVELSNENLIKQFIPILDNFENALKHKSQDDEYSKGMALIYIQLLQVVEDAGVKIIPANGKFDHNLHEVLMTEKSDKEEGTILEEFQKGYTLGGKVIRHSKVKIAKNK